VLQLINLPTTYSGYKYRCVLDGINSNVNEVRFSNIWNGNSGSNWFEAANWSCGIVPDENTAVVVPGGISVYPVINANTIIKSISVHPGATVTLANLAVLQIKGR
jgi:hypothetical protein